MPQNRCPESERRLLPAATREAEYECFLWDSMMVVDETTRSLFPSDLFIQPADQPPVVTENLSLPMLELYRAAGIFTH